jgi:branched-chain amino acid aminotransferase
VIAIINGVYSENAVVPVNDRGFTLGDGLFETIPLYDGRPFLLDRHLLRLRDSAEIISLRIPFTDDDIANAVTNLAGRGGISRGVTRLTVTRGAGPRGYGIADCDSPTWVVTVEPYEPMSQEKWERGFALASVTIRKNVSSPLNGVKSTSALERIMILDEAKKTGADEALVLSTAGHIACGSAVNVFWVREGRIETPSLECGILPGVTRALTLELAGKEKMETVEGRFPPSVLMDAQEVFVTNSLIGIVPVTRIDGREISAGPGPVTRRLAELYKIAIS